MDFFFNPRSIAVIGATPNPLKGGNALIKNLKLGYRGPIYPVNPNHGEIEGLACFSSVSAIAEPVDLAIIFIPAALVPEALRDCAAGGVRGVIIESGGFAETGERGLALQEECRAIGQETGIRLWGPNCMGLVDARRNYVFSFMSPETWDEGLVPGNVSLIAQSGMISGGFIIDLMSHGTMGVSKVCSIGNRIDVDECELLDYLMGDAQTAVVALYLESIPKGRVFLEKASRSPKPVVVLRGGRSPRGSRAAMSHTASLSGDDRIIKGALAQAGIVQATDFKQMMDISRALAVVPTGIGRGRIAILTFSGGSGIVATDLLTNHGMDVADLSPETHRRLKEFFPPWMPVANPVDIWPAAEVLGSAEAFRRAVEVLVDDSRVDAILLNTFAGGRQLDLNLDTLATEVRRTGKPIFFWLLGKQKEAREFQGKAQNLGMPVYRELSRAVEALHAAYTHGGRREPFGVGSVASQIQGHKKSELREVLQRMASIEGPLDEFESKRVLAAAGISTVQEAMVADPAHALEMAREFGFPVVLKGLIAGGIHKTEMGLVRLGLQGPQEVSSAFEGLTRRMGGKGCILVQKHIRADLELICGMVRDPQFGPSVMFGLGGVTAELLRDVVFRVAPFKQEDALDMMDGIRAKGALVGFRGSRPVDRGSLAHILTTLGWIALEAPQITEIDINPLLVVDGRLIVVDATVILASKHTAGVEVRGSSSGVFR